MGKRIEERIVKSKGRGEFGEMVGMRIVMSNRFVSLISEKSHSPASVLGSIRS